MPVIAQGALVPQAGAAETFHMMQAKQVDPSIPLVPKCFLQKYSKQHVRRRLQIVAPETLCNHESHTQAAVVADTYPHRDAKETLSWNILATLAYCVANACQVPVVFDETVLGSERKNVPIPVYTSALVH